MNLFMTYAFDKWMEREHPNNPFSRYADDAVAHCRSEAEAKKLLASIEERLKECRLEKQFVRGFERELDLWKSLKHDNIARLLGYFIISGSKRANK